MAVLVVCGEALALACPVRPTCPHCRVCVDADRCTRRSRSVPVGRCAAGVGISYAGFNLRTQVRA